jgi:cytochrome bd-type quinol oxidase subunit 1
MLLADFIQTPGGARWVIGSIALFHVAVGSLAIGFAFVVTCLQMIAWRRKNNRYDLMAKRVQLWHVCVYNIGTINAIGLVFALSGLYPQFWSQIFVQFFWTIMVEEFLFLLLATTLTFHYFFWDRMWGHKRLHIFVGALLTPLFFLQFYIINGMGAYMMTPGAAEDTVTQWGGTSAILGWDFAAFYNPSFLMLTLHRTLANFAYGGFFVAGVFGAKLLWERRERFRDALETGARAAFGMAFAMLLGLPVVGYFYAHAIMKDPHGYHAYVNLMWGKGDVVAGGIDWWWTKHVIVAAMIAMGLVFFHRLRGGKDDQPPARYVVYGVAVFYLMFYAAMGMVMTWFFFWMICIVFLAAALVAWHMLAKAEGSGRTVFLTMGVLSFLTVMLGGYVREASRPRFVPPPGRTARPGEEIDRMPAYDYVYAPQERAGDPGRMTMRLDRPPWADETDRRRRPLELVDTGEPPTTEALISRRCIECHTLERLRLYRGTEWNVVIARMRAYGMKMSDGDAASIAAHLGEGKPY